MNVFRCCVAGLGLAASVTALSLPALADGYYRRNPGLSACCFNWTGFYIGANAGIAGDDLSNSLSVVNGTPALIAPVSIPGVNASGSQNLDSNSLIGGVQAGYNVQSGAVVWGLELDINRMHLKGNAGGPFNFAGGGQYILTEEASANWLFTLRPRLGVAMDRSLLYITGGLAVTKLDFNQFFFASPPPASLNIPASETKAGWTLGAGYEAAISQNWTFKTEYLFSRFDIDNTSGTLTVAGVGSGTFVDSFDHFNIHTLRMGINYKFGDCCATPLK